MQAGRGAGAVAPRLLALVALVVVAADQATKALALARLDDGESIAVIQGVLHWTLQRNPGAAFGLFQRYPGVFTVLATIISIAIIVAARNVKDRLAGVALGLVLGGAVGNLIDRVARPPAPFRGHVIDFIDLRVWPVFNIADAAIVVGAAVMVVAEMRAARREDGADDGEAPADAPPAGEGDATEDR